MCSIFVKGGVGMNHDIYEKIKSVFFENQGYATTREMSERGINRYYLNALKHLEIIERVKTGVYRWRDYDFDYDFELVEIFKIIPKGVLCLKSALSYHGLSNYNPWQYEVAIERSEKIIVPEYPPVKIVYFTEKFYNLGITEVKQNGCNVRVYDLEKSICDCIRYRNKIGIEMVRESLNEYLKRKDRNLNKLMIYAEKCRVQKILKEYLEVLL
jgi:predicted transcriptional regulator of viral defense system